VIHITLDFKSFAGRSVFYEIGRGPAIGPAPMTGSAYPPFLPSPLAARAGGLGTERKTAASPPYKPVKGLRHRGKR